jgi:transposase
METKRAVIIALHHAGKTNKDIFNTLKSQGIGLRFIQRTIKRFKECGSTTDRQRSGRPKSASTPAMVQKIRCRLLRNPRQSLRKMAVHLSISSSSVRRIAKNNLKCFPYKLRKCQTLTPAAKVTRLHLCRELKKRFAGDLHRGILFTDEKLFTVEEVFNHQNTRIWSPNVKSIPENLLRVNRSQKPASVMVWGGITSTGKTPLIFIEKGVKINGMVYRQEVLEKVVKPWAQGHFNDRHWVFQQDNAPAHRAKDTQAWIMNQFPASIAASEWPPYSCDLNPMDYSVWSILEQKVCSIKHSSIESLKQHLEEEWAAIPTDTLRKIVNDFPRRLVACVKAKGGHFE